MTAIITEFQIDQFRGGNPLRILDLGNGLNVALRHSDDGRDQLLNIVPFTLYGKFRLSQANRDRSCGDGQHRLAADGQWCVHRST